MMSVKLAVTNKHETKINHNMVINVNIVDIKKRGLFRIVTYDSSNLLGLRQLFNCNAI